MYMLLQGILSHILFKSSMFKLRRIGIETIIMPHSSLITPIHIRVIIFNWYYINIFAHVLMIIYALFGVGRWMLLAVFVISPCLRTLPHVNVCYNPLVIMYLGLFIHLHWLQPSAIFLTKIQVENGTGSHIAEQILTDLQSRNIPSIKLLGFGTDGASIMTGTGKGLPG